MTTNIAGYIRTSTKQQVVINQKIDIVNWLEQTGRTVTNLIFYVDAGISGGNLSLHKRKFYLELIEEIKANKFNLVIVAEASRIAINKKDYLDFLLLCRRHGCEVEIVGKGKVASLNQEEVLLDAILAEEELNLIKARTKRGLTIAKLKGVKLGAPSGNTYRKGKIKEYDYKLVKSIHELSKQGLSSRKIKARLIADGHKEICHITIQKILKRHPIAAE